MQSSGFSQFVGQQQNQQQSHFFSTKQQLNNRTFSTAFINTPTGLAQEVIDEQKQDEGARALLKPEQLGTVTTSLEKLQMSVVKKIEAELKDADINNDGRYDIAPPTNI
jgi:hypothetical protein